MAHREMGQTPRKMSMINTATRNPPPVTGRGVYGSAQARSLFGPNGLPSVGSLALTSVVGSSPDGGGWPPTMVPVAPRSDAGRCPWMWQGKGNVAGPRLIEWHGVASGPGGAWDGRGKGKGKGVAPWPWRWPGAGAGPRWHGMVSGSGAWFVPYRPPLQGCLHTPACNWMPGGARGARGNSTAAPPQPAQADQGRGGGGKSTGGGGGKGAGRGKGVGPNRHQVTSPVFVPRDGWQVAGRMTGYHTTFAPRNPSFATANPWQALSSAGSQMRRATEAPFPNAHRDTQLMRPAAGMAWVAAHHGSGVIAQGCRYVPAGNPRSTAVPWGAPRQGSQGAHLRWTTPQDSDGSQWQGRNDRDGLLRRSDASGTRSGLSALRGTCHSNSPASQPSSQPG